MATAYPGLPCQPCSRWQESWDLCWAVEFLLVASGEGLSCPECIPAAEQGCEVFLWHKERHPSLKRLPATCGDKQWFSVGQHLHPWELYVGVCGCHHTGAGILLRC